MARFYWQGLNKRIPMKCPRCVQIVGPGAESCPHCGYTLQSACALYGAWSVVASRLMDVEESLDPAQREAIDEAISSFERRFPQLFLLMYLGPLPAPASPRQFAFWLLNHAAVAEPAALQPNERGLLLVVDPRGGTAVLAGGYYIECLVSQEELDTVLKGAGKPLAAEDYPNAVQAIAGGLTGLLERRSREMARNPGRFQPPRPEPVPVPFPPLIRTGESSMADSPDEGFAGSRPDPEPPEPAELPAGRSTPPLEPAEGRATQSFR